MTITHKQYLTFIACWFLLWPCFSQNDTATPKMKGRPDIPGSFILELGINSPQDKPDNFETGFWGSRTFNLYYQLDKPIGKSHFSFHPGFGFGFERYKFKNTATLDTIGDKVALVPASDMISVIPKKSMLITNYVDLTGELRFSTNPDDPNRTFKISIGGRIGYLFNSSTKLKYKEDGDPVKLKNKRNFNLNDIRYGAYLKVGGGNISVFSYYNLSPLFRSGKGPDDTTMSNLTFGISLTGL